MEIPAVGLSETHQTWTGSGLQKLAFTAQGSTSESSALSANTSHRGDDCLHGTQSSLFELDKEKQKNFVCVCHNNIEVVEAVCLKEPEHSVIPGEAPLDTSPLGSAQLPEAGTVSTTCGSNGNCCSLSVQSDQVVQNRLSLTVDFKRPILNGHACIPPEDLSPILNLDFMHTQTVPDSSPRAIDLPRIVKHKPSSITFSHYTCPSETSGCAFVNESSDDGESSLEDEEGDDDGDDDDDDVFPELPQSKECLAKNRQRSKDKMKRRGTVSARAEINHTARNCGCEAEGEISSKEESPQVKSPWSESMSQLMRKLDQLNLDIEEALSANSSPSDTPCTARKKQKKIPMDYLDL
ncbi:uncharacterized protein LOC121943472 [Plectropomus leopardus]|uniref:uncharacterized protein LOC121943472 n=1 Tax=Plectropomus leopardus TaxID=160734 RepID=UPI001C4A8B29|nr:uncharacterized protein LOC121943472 [Plectropomus leopardus]